MGNDGRFRPWQQRLKDTRAGDIVLSFDPATGEHLPDAVTKLYPGETEIWVNLTYAQNGLKKSRPTTPEHPFLIPDGQFAAISRVDTANSTDAMTYSVLPMQFMTKAQHV